MSCMRDFSKRGCMTSSESMSRLSAMVAGLGVCFVERFFFQTIGHTFLSNTTSI